MCEAPSYLLFPGGDAVRRFLPIAYLSRQTGGRVVFRMKCMIVVGFQFQQSCFFESEDFDSYWIFLAASVGIAEPKQEEKEGGRHASALLHGRDMVWGRLRVLFRTALQPYRSALRRLPYRASESFVTGGRSLADVVIGREEK